MRNKSKSAVSERRLRRESLAVETGYPLLCRALGLSYGEKGTGVRTICDTVVFPFMISASSQKLHGELVVANPDGRLDFSKLLSISAVLQGVFALVRTEFLSRDGSTAVKFDIYAPEITSSLRRDSALILKIATPARSDGELPRRLNLLLQSLSLSTAADQSLQE